MLSISNFKKISPNIWEIPKTYRKAMKVPARIYASEEMLKDILEEEAVEQLINITMLRGIEKYALAMPDIHQGYGFPIGGVAALRTEDGVISPGGVGYDINCGVRLLTSSYKLDEIKEKLTDLANQIQRDVPSGVGRGGNIKLKSHELHELLNQGMKWALEKGYAYQDDLDHAEEGGCFEPANADHVSEKAIKRGSDQVGTLGAGNHFIEMQKVEEVYDKETAEVFGLYENQVVVMVHTGSRGLGHQVCTDHVSIVNNKLEDYNIKIPNRDLACVPFKSPEGQRYFQAMAAAANFAWVNRQVITHYVRNAWEQILGDGDQSKLNLIYDVAHNMAKVENHDGNEYIVHRKGATRAFGPGHPEIPEKYQKTGQPIFIPGSMGTASYVLAGTDKAMRTTFGSTCHGAGRQMSRKQAKKNIDYNQLKQKLDEMGVIMRTGSKKGLLEEAPEAYKDVHNVVDIVVETGIAKRVARLRPLAIIKG